MSLNTAGLNALPRELGSTWFSGENNTIRQLAGAIGTCSCDYYIYDSSNFHIALELSLENGSIAAIQLAKLSSIFGSGDVPIYLCYSYLLKH